MPEGAKGCQRVSDGAKGCQMTLQRARECQNGPDGAKGCQMVPRGRQRVPEGPDWDGRSPRIGQDVRFDFCHGLHSRSGGSRPGGYRCHDILLPVGMVSAMEGPPGSRDKIKGEDYGRWP